MSIPNYNRYKHVIEWWLANGYKNINNEDMLRIIHRLISKYGKRYDVLYSVLPKGSMSKYKVGNILNLQLLATTNSMIKSDNNDILVICGNPVGISINKFVENDKKSGYIFDNEILSYGKYELIQIDENIYALKHISKKVNDYSDLIDKVAKMSEKINNKTKEKKINIEKLKKLNNNKKENNDDEVK